MANPPIYSDWTPPYMSTAPAPLNYDPVNVFRDVSTEKDPHGTEAKTPGAKLDFGKAPVLRGAVQYFPRALSEVANLSAAGAAKYSWKGWEAVPGGIDRYGDALLRHLVGEAVEGPWDSKAPEGAAILHATAVAWNALARLELILRDMETPNALV